MPDVRLYVRNRSETVLLGYIPEERIFWGIGENDTGMVWQCEGSTKRWCWGLSGEGNEKMEKYWVNGNNKYRKISWIGKYELVMVKLGKYDDMWGFRYGK